MRKLNAILLGLALAFAVSAWALHDDDNAKTTGWIVDSKCGAKAAHEGNEACTKKCLEAGAKPVLVTDKGKTVLNIDNPDAIKGHEGHHVAVTGKTSGDSIHVDNLEMADMAK